MNVLVAGGTGFIGRRMAAALVERGDVVTVVCRDPSKAQASGLPGVGYRGWLPELDAYDAVVNLAGEPIFGRRWNASVRAAIRESRVQSTRRIVKAIAMADDPPDVLVNASAIGIYGSRGSEPLPESAGPGDDFMAGVCQAWEAEAETCPVRTVRLRIGVVVGPGGGALSAMLPPFKFGAGGPIGLGRQHFSWVHIDDVVGLVLWAIDNDDVSGPVNATAPGVVTNAAFSKALGRVLRRPAFMPVPPLALRVMLGQVAQVLTGSQRCVPEAAERGGYGFRHPEIEGALRDVLGRGTTPQTTPAS